jgi:hypothetical protein
MKVLTLWRNKKYICNSILKDNVLILRQRTGIKITDNQTQQQQKLFGSRITEPGKPM